MSLEPSSKTFLLLADISGYTHFMRESPVASSHARQIIVRLLRSLISASEPPLNIAELEGDAVFFYAPTSDENERRISIEVRNQMLRLFSRFNAEAERLIAITSCQCDACSNVGRLRLKQILHFGLAATEQVHQFNKLFGVDVILVHKLLKNSVPSDEYVLMTAQAYAVTMDFHGLTPRILRERVEEFGFVDTVVFYPRYPTTASRKRNASRTTPMDALAWKLRLMWNTLGVSNRGNSAKTCPLFQSLR